MQEQQVPTPLTRADNRAGWIAIVAVVVYLLMVIPVWATRSWSSLVYPLLFLVYLHPFFLLIYFLPFCMQRARRRARMDWVVVFALLWLAVALPVATFLYGMWPGKTEIIARATAPDGTELCVTHVNKQFENAVGFYYKRPGKPWGWFYMDHEAMRWWSGRISLSPDGQTAYIWRGRAIAASFTPATETFRRPVSDAGWNGAQLWMPEGWTPEYSVAHGGAQDFNGVRPVNGTTRVN